MHHSQTLTVVLFLFSIFTARGGEFAEVARIQGDAPDGGKFGRFAQLFRPPLGSVSLNGNLQLMAGVFPEGEPTVLRWAAFSGTPNNLRLRAVESKTLASSTTIDRLSGSGIVNDEGATAFLATVRQGGESLSAVFVAAGGNLDLVAIEGNGVSGLPAGVSLGSFEGLVFNNDGTVAFLAALAGDGVTNLDRALVAGRYGALAAVMLTGGTVPSFASETVFSRLSVPMLNHDGELCVLAEMVGSGITSNDNAGFWIGRPGAMKLVLREGDSVPGFPETTVFSNTGFTPSSPTHSFADSCQFAFLASVSGPGVNRAAARMMFAGTIGESLEVIARSGDSAPGLGDIPFDTGLASSPLVSSSGSVTFIASLDSTHPDVESGIFDGTDTALFHGKPGNIKLIARRGDAKSGNNDATFGGFNIGTQIGMSATGWMTFSDNGFNVVDPDGNLVFVISNLETEVDRGDGEFRQVIASSLFGPSVRSNGSDGQGGLISNAGDVIALMTFQGEAQTAYSISLSEPQFQIAITSIEWDIDRQDVALRFPSSTDRIYALEESSTLTHWTEAQNSIAGTGTEVTLRVPKPNAQTHWRVLEK